MTKQGRNDPCACGSGKKFKQCCADKPTQAVSPQALMQGLQAGLPHLQVLSSAERGMPPLQVEAAAFAWLARQTVLGLPGNLPKVTGAQGARILGGIFKA